VTSATLHKSKITPANGAGSVGSVPKSSEAIPFETPKDAAVLRTEAGQ